MGNVGLYGADGEHQLFLNVSARASLSEQGKHLFLPMRQMVALREHLASFGDGVGDAAGIFELLPASVGIRYLRRVSVFVATAFVGADLGLAVGVPHEGHNADVGGQGHQGAAHVGDMTSGGHPDKGASRVNKAADAEHAERGYVERVERERDDGPEKEVGAGLIDVDDDGHGCAHKHVLGGLGHSRNEQARDHYHDGGLEPEGHGKGSGARKGTPHESGEACRHYGQLRKAP